MSKRVTVDKAIERRINLCWLNSVVYLRGMPGGVDGHVMDITRESVPGNVGIALIRSDAVKLKKWLDRWLKKTEPKKSAKRKACEDTNER